MEMDSTIASVVRNIILASIAELINILLTLTSAAAVIPVIIQAHRIALRDEM